MTLSDETVAAAQSGDAAAVAAVYRELAPRLVGYLSVRGAEDPEALTNDVFVAVIPRLSTIEGGAEGVRRFVYSVAHRRYIDEVRRRARRPAQVGYEPDMDPRLVESAESSAVGLASLAEVSHYLRRLTEEQLEVVSLRIIADVSLAETAEILGRSVGSVKQLQRRALVSLREMMTAERARDA